MLKVAFCFYNNSFVSMMSQYLGFIYLWAGNWLLADKLWLWLECQNDVLYRRSISERARCILHTFSVTVWRLLSVLLIIKSRLSVNLLWSSLFFTRLHRVPATTSTTFCPFCLPCHSETRTHLRRRRRRRLICISPLSTPLCPPH